MSNKQARVERRAAQRKATKEKEILNRLANPPKPSKKNPKQRKLDSLKSKR